MSTADKPLRVAIVHDWLLGGGAELVVEQLHKLYPEAPIYTSYCTDEWRKRLDGKVITGWLQHLGAIRKFIPFLRILWFQNLKFDDYDLVISSSGAEAKGIRVNKKPKKSFSDLLAALGAREHRKGVVHEGTASAERNVQQRDGSKFRKTLHVNYCHAPTHYYWSRYDEYMAHPGFGALDPLARIGLKLLAAPLRRWDLKAAKRPDYIIANSTHIQAEIKKYYGRDSTVVFPPIDTARFGKPENQELPRSGFQISGRQTPYKRFDLAVQACTELGLQLRVIGDGPDHARLVSLAGPTVTFLGRVSDAELEKEFGSATALVFPGLDDFGITPVEAMAAGTPVIAYRAGGSLDYVVPGQTGEFFAERIVESLKTALLSFDPSTYQRSVLQTKAAEFSPELFRTKLQSIINDQLGARS
ncbi:glycosyltransferase [Aeromicrobium sp.]|nr:glycosyltransferase [Candidatus Saccharibacteria bacterium]